MSIKQLLTAMKLMLVLLICLASFGFIRNYNFNKIGSPAIEHIMPEVFIPTEAILKADVTTISNPVD